MLPAQADLSDFDGILTGSGTLGVAVSGGGDSVALLYALAQWGRRPLHVFHVDHRIHPDSAAWAQGVADHAARLGLPCTILTWDEDKPATGLSAAARQARHGLLAQAARAQGLRVLCLAHTADDIAEAAAMRTHGSNVGTPRTWSPSPVWPQGRGIWLCRPWLKATRAELRAYLTEQGIAWIDDPANDSPKSLRALIRQQGVTPTQTAPDDRLPKAEVESLLYDQEGWSALGLLRLRADRWRDLPQPLARRVLAAAAVCAGGGDHLPRSDSIKAVCSALPDGQVRTLSGARIWQADGLIHVVREPGDIGRNRESRQDTLWDGRFEIVPHATVTTVHGHSQALNDTDRAFLKSLPQWLRPALPIVLCEGPHLAVPAYGLPDQRQNETVAPTCWVLPRFLAATCQVVTETDL